MVICNAKKYLFIIIFNCMNGWFGVLAQNSLFLLMSNRFSVGIWKMFCLGYITDIIFVRFLLNSTTIKTELVILLICLTAAYPIGSTKNTVMLGGSAATPGQPLGTATTMQGSSVATAVTQRAGTLSATGAAVAPTPITAVREPTLHTLPVYHCQTRTVSFCARVYRRRWRTWKSVETSCPHWLSWLMDNSRLRLLPVSKSSSRSCW